MYLRKLFYLFQIYMLFISWENKSVCMPIPWIHPSFLYLYQRSGFSDSLMWFYLYTYFLFFFLGESLFFFSFLLTECSHVFVNYSNRLVMAFVSCQWSFSVLSWFCDHCSFCGLQIEWQFSWLFSTEHYFLDLSMLLPVKCRMSLDPYLTPEIFWLKSLCFPATFPTGW